MQASQAVGFGVFGSPAFKVPDNAAPDRRAAERTVPMFPFVVPVPEILFIIRTRYSYKVCISFSAPSMNIPEMVPQLF